MKLVEINEEEFETFAYSNPLFSFHQTKEWAKLKKNNGWSSIYLGYKDNGEILGAGLILRKKLIFNKEMWYSPRGFLIDYSDKELLANFTKDLKKYAKKNGAVFIKIDPYILYKERDIDSNIVVDGIDNSSCVDNLNSLGYKHFGFSTITNKELQPRWIFVTPVKNKTIDEIMNKMDPKTRQILRKNERDGIKCREISYDELPLFKDIMQHTGDRRSFIDRPLKYYQDMYNCLAPRGILKILVAELDTVKLIEKLNKEISDLELDYDSRKKKYEEAPEKMNELKYISKQKEITNNIDRLRSRIVEIENLKSENGDVITLGGILFLICGNEVLSLVGGSYSKFMKFQSAYTVHFEGLKYALNNGYDRYNFYGISGDFNESNPLYGLYSFKRDFGGNVVELIGEFDLIVNKFYYFVYKFTFAFYKKIKNIFFRIRGGK